VTGRAVNVDSIRLPCSCAWMADGHTATHSIASSKNPPTFDLQDAM
jgi:hypothetical protein